MNFRPATDADYVRLAAMHSAQGLPYPLPPLNHPSIVTKLIAERGEKIVFAALLRVSAEAYLLASPEGTPRERWQALLDGNDELMRAAWKAGFSDINCWIPPDVKVFGKRLERLGWEKNSWDCFSIWPGNVIAT